MYRKESRLCTLYRRSCSCELSFPPSVESPDATKQCELEATFSVHSYETAIECLLRMNGESDPWITQQTLCVSASWSAGQVIPQKEWIGADKNIIRDTMYIT